MGAQPQDHCGLRHTQMDCQGFPNEMQLESKKTMQPVLMCVASFRNFMIEEAVVSEKTLLGHCTGGPQRKSLCGSPANGRTLPTLLAL